MGNPNHDPKTGEFSEGPGGGSAINLAAKADRWSAAGSNVSANVRKAVDFVKSPEGRKAIVHEAVATGIMAMMYHGGQYAEPIADDYVKEKVRNLAADFQVTTGHAHDMMRAGIAKLIAARKAMHI